MVLGMALFAVGDGFVKGSAGVMAPGARRDHPHLRHRRRRSLRFGLLSLAAGPGGWRGAEAPPVHRGEHMPSQRPSHLHLVCDRDGLVPLPIEMMR